MEIKVSVIIPTFNRASLLRETLDSVMAQTINNWECIVVDDGSTDGTDELMKEYVKDPRFIFLRRPSDFKKGGNTCRNYGLKYARGEYIQFLDSDDLISKNKLEEQIKALKEVRTDAIAISKWEYFKDSIHSLPDSGVKPTYINFEHPLDLLRIFAKHGTFLPQHTFLIRKELIDQVGYWNEDLIINQDGEFFARIIVGCSKILFVPNAVAYYRIGTGNKTNTWSSEHRITDLILSWRLISDTIESKYGIKNHPYVRQAKTSIYKSIKKSYPTIVKDNQDFFRSKYPPIMMLYKKSMSKLQLFAQKKMKRSRGDS